MYTLSTESLNIRVENPGNNGMLKIKGKNASPSARVIPSPHPLTELSSPNSGKKPSLDYGYYHQTKDQIGGSLAKEKGKKRTAQFNNITSLGYYILEKNWQTASLQRVD